MPLHHSEATVFEQFEWSETRPSVAVVRLTSDACDSTPTELPPVAEFVDTDALDSHLRTADTRTAVEFIYHGVAVYLRSDGVAAAEPLAE